MSQIKEYQQQVEANANAPDKRVQPNAFEMFPDNAGKGVMAVGDVMQQENERDDAANVHVMMAKARSDWTTHLQQTASQAATSVEMVSGTVTVDGDKTTNPPQPLVSVGNFADKYSGDLSTYLTNAKQNVKTGNGARLFDSMAANLSGELNEKAMGAQAHLTGLKAVADYNASLNSYRNTLLGDPSQFQSVLKEAAGGLGSWVDIPADQRIKLMEQTSEKLALSAIQGQVKQDPQVALKQLNDGQWDQYLSANGKYMAEHQADQGIRAQQTEQVRQAREQDAQEKRERMSTNNGFLGKFVDGNLDMNSVLNSNLQPFGEGSKETWLQMINKQNADGLKPVKTDPAWFRDTFDKIHRPVGDPDKITNEDTLNQAFVDGRVGQAQLQFLRGEVQNDRTDKGQLLGEVKSSFYKMASKQFDKSAIGVPDPVGAEQAYKFQMYVESLVADAREKKENEFDLFDPKSKNYAGKYISQFQRSTTEQAQSLGNGVVKDPGVQPTLPEDDKRKPGETPAQWRMRTGR